MINKTLTLKPYDRFILNNKECILLTKHDTFDWDYHGHHDPYTEVTWCYADETGHVYTERYEHLMDRLNEAAGAMNQTKALWLCNRIEVELRCMRHKGVNPDVVDSLVSKLDEFSKSLSEIE